MDNLLSFSFSDEKINWKRPQIADILLSANKLGSRNRMLVSEFLPDAPKQPFLRMRSETIAKHRPKSSKCEAHYIKSTSHGTIPTTRLQVYTVNRLRDFAHDSRPNTGQNTIFANNWIYHDRRAIKVAKRIGKSGSGISGRKFSRTHGSQKHS